MFFSPKQHRLLVRDITEHWCCMATLCVCEQVVMDFRAAMLNLFLKKDMHF